METPLHITKLAEKLHAIFYGTKGFWTTATDKTRSDGKKVHKTFAIKEQLDLKHYEEHLMSKTNGLTVSPLYELDMVYFGAIDVDVYKWSEEDKLKFIKNARKLDLIPARTKSNGIHLYAFTSEDKGVPGVLMRGRLKCCRDELDLPKETEIFPKQDSRLEEEYGNGITIPFRSFASGKDEFKTFGLSYVDNDIVELNIGTFCKIAETQTTQKEFGLNYHEKFNNYQDPIQVAEDEADKKQITRKQIITNILKGVEHSSGGTFDNWILLYVAKSVKALDSDYNILEQLSRVKEKSDKASVEYFQAKIDSCRKKFEIEDPDKVRRKLVNRLIYVLDEDRYYDTKKFKSYSPEKIDRSFAQYFTKPSCTNFIKSQSNRLEVENWVWAPKEYNPNKIIIEIGGLKYLNSYKPNTLKALNGETYLWEELLNYLFLNNKRHKDQFLDWLSFQLQHMGTKLRYAIIIYSKEYQIGKGTLWRVIEELFGKWNTKEIDIEQALDHSKEFLRTSAIVCIDEMESTGTFGQKKTLLNAMKRIITAGSLGHRARYSDYSNVPTLTNYILFTNNQDAISIPKNEKRYSVYMHDKERLPQLWYDNFHKWIDEGGSQFILHDLMLRDVRKFNPNQVAPHTSFNGLMSENGAHPLAKLLKEKFDGNFQPLRADIVSTLGVYGWLKENRELGRFRTNDVANALEFIGGEKLEQTPIDTGDDDKKRMTLFIIRNHSRYNDMPKAEVGKVYWKQQITGPGENVDIRTGNNSFKEPWNEMNRENDGVIPTKKPTINL